MTQTWTSARPNRKENVEFQEELILLITSFIYNVIQFFMNENVFYNCSENPYHNNYIRDLFPYDQIVKIIRGREAMEEKEREGSKVREGNLWSQNNNTGN